jgi:uncharacterized membrane protein YgcG
LCVASKPKIPAPSAAEQDKPLPVLRNPILDGLLGNIAATRAGTSAFRIDLVNPLTIPPASSGGSSGNSSGTSSGGSSTATSSSGTSSGGGGGGGGSRDFRMNRF